MRSLFIRNSVTAVVLATAALCSHAQEQTAPPPSGLQQIDQGDEPAITIRKPETKAEITERRQGGQVTEIKVETGRSTYYLRPNQPTGNAMSGDAQSHQVRPVEWKVHEFDLGQPKVEDKNRDIGSEPIPAMPAPTK